MDKIIFAISLIFAFAYNALAQTSPCPSLTVIGPSGLTQPGEAETFTVTLGKDAENYKIEYLWTVSDGKLIEGQGTNKIKVLRNDIVNTIIATVAVKGLPEDCPNSNSASGIIICPGPEPMPRKIDEFSISPPQIGKFNLQVLDAELTSAPTATVHIFETFKRGASKAAIKQKISQTLKFLDHQAHRIKIFMSLGNNNLTVFWIVPGGATPPSPEEGFQEQVDKLFPPKKNAVKRTKRVL